MLGCWFSADPQIAAAGRGDPPLFLLSAKSTKTRQKGSRNPPKPTLELHGMRDSGSKEAQARRPCSGRLSVGFGLIWGSSDFFWFGFFVLFFFPPRITVDFLCVCI